MNPLTVLTGAMIMRQREQMARSDGALCLDDARRLSAATRPRVAPVELRFNGQPHALRVVGTTRSAPRTNAP